MSNDNLVVANESLAKRKRPNLYERVNGSWPEKVPALTKDEAIPAAKRLYRKAFGKAFKGKWKLTTGNRYSWNRSGVFSVNWTGREITFDEKTGKFVPFGSGWKDLVHDMSHYAHQRLSPDQRPHSSRHAHLERELIEYVVSSGWLEGALRKEPKPEAPKRGLSKCSGFKLGSLHGARNESERTTQSRKSNGH